MLTSVTEDYGLVCDELFLQSIFNSLYLGGMFVGSFMIGMISDKFGRLKAMIFSIFLVSGSGILAVFVNNKVLFAFLRLTCGMGGMGCTKSSLPWLLLWLFRLANSFWHLKRIF